MLRGSKYTNTETRLQGRDQGVPRAILPRLLCSRAFQSAQSFVCIHAYTHTVVLLTLKKGITPTMSSSQMASNNISPARPPVSSRSLTRMRSLSLRERAMQPMFVATLRHSRQTRGTVVDHSMKPAKREFRSTKCACTHVCMQCVCMQCTHEHHARVKSACRVQVSRMHVVCMYVCKCA